MYLCTLRVCMLCSTRYNGMLNPRPLWSNGNYTRQRRTATVPMTCNSIDNYYRLNNLASNKRINAYMHMHEQNAINDSGAVVHVLCVCVIGSQPFIMKMRSTLPNRFHKSSWKEKYIIKHACCVFYSGGRIIRNSLQLRRTFRVIDSVAIPSFFFCITF